MEEYYYVVDGYAYGPYDSLLEAREVIENEAGTEVGEEVKIVKVVLTGVPQKRRVNYDWQ